MEPNRFKVMIALSSDHAGIAEELKRLEREIYYVVARIEDGRHVRDYLQALGRASYHWHQANPHAAPWERKK